MILMYIVIRGVMDGHLQGIKILLLIDQNEYIFVNQPIFFFLTNSIFHFSIKAFYVVSIDRIAIKKSVAMKKRRAN